MQELDFTPYAFDLAKQDLVEVGVPRAMPAQQQPFFYMDQFKQAVALRHLPVSSIIRRRSTPELPRLLFVFSIGRAGSTLISRMLDAAGTVSISEPDILSALSDKKICAALALREPGWRKLYLYSLSALVARFGRPASMAVKLRAQSSNVFHAERLHRLLPEARHVLVLRDITDWSLSYVTKFLVDAKTLQDTMMASLKTAAHMRELGAKCHVVFYEDILSDPFAFLALATGQPLDDAQCNAVKAVLGRDSQDNLITTSTDPDRLQAALEEREIFLAQWRAQRPIALLKHLGLDEDPRLHGAK